MMDCKRWLAWGMAFALCCPVGTMAEAAWVETDKGPLNMRSRADSNAVVLARIPNGTRIEALETEQEWSRVAYANREGYVKTAYLDLLTQLVGKTVYPDEAYLYVRQSADRDAESVAVVRSAEGMTILDVLDDWVLVSCMDGKRHDVTGYVHLEDIAQRREAPGNRPSAAVHAAIELSTDVLRVGDVLDVSVQCDGDAAYQYCLYRDGEAVFHGEPVPHGDASYRPRQPGRYRLEVIAHDPQGGVVGCESFFDVLPADRVAAARSAPDGEADSMLPPYSQKDGWWADKPYGKKNLESSGCAIFTLSYALQMLGNCGNAALPQNLARQYGALLAESGTLTGRLLARVSDEFGFTTSSEKIHDASAIEALFREGAVFTVLVADGHIALAAGLDSDSEKVWIVDSAPSATFERIQDTSLYVRDGRGRFQAVQRLEDLPGARYFFETDAFGGAVYALDLAYVAQRGVRPIAPSKPIS